MKKGAIFDHDGLMFDTEKIWQSNWQKEAAHMGITLPEEFKHEICGTSGERMNAVVCKYYHLQDGSELIQRVIENVRNDEMIHLDEKPGLRKILELFKEHGVKMAVASSSPVSMLEKNLNNDGIRNYFSAVVSGQQVAHGKPAPDVFLLAADQIGIDPKDCYVFEDAFNGVHAGHNAGCTTIMIPDMSQPDEEIRSIADGIYPTLGDAADAIKRGDL